MGVLASVLVGPNLGGEAKHRVRRRFDAVLAVRDALQRIHLRLLAVQAAIRSELAEPNGIVLLVGERSNRLPTVLLIGLVVDLLRLVEIILVCVRQPRRELNLSGRGRVLRL